MPSSSSLSFALLSISFAATSVLASPPPACSLPFYRAISSALATYSEAQRYCTSVYPIATPACYATSTSISTVGATTTITTTDATSVQTNTVPTTVIDGTNTVSVYPDTTATSTSTVYTTTLLGHQSPSRKEKRQNGARGAQGAAASSKWSAFKKQASSVVKTACACIETTPACTTSTQTTVSISTSTYTAVVHQTAVVTSDTTQTAHETATETFTYQPRSTATTTTQTVTSSCPQATSVACNGACISGDFQSDPNNCGSCGNKCATKFCRNGVCACPPVTNAYDSRYDTMCRAYDPNQLTRFCYYDANLVGYCINFGDGCGNPCSTAADCAAGQACIINGCGNPIGSGTCAAMQAIQ